MHGSAVKTDFALHEVIVLSGFSKHMLDYLVREDILRPGGNESGRGRRRRYSYADVVLLRALHMICAGKGKIRHLKQSLSVLREELGPLHAGERIDKLLFVEGDELCVRTSSESGRQLRTGQMTLAFVVDLHVVTGHVAGAIELDRRTGCFSLKAEPAQQAEAERQRTWAPIHARRRLVNGGTV